MMPRNKILATLFLLLLAAGVLIFISSKSDLDFIGQRTPSPSLAPARDIPANWRTYTGPSMGLSIKYDPQLKMDEDAEGVRWYMWGPTQAEGTEVYDGFILSFSKTDYAGTLDDYVVQQMQIFREVGEITADLYDVNINGIEGKAFKGSSLGEYTIIFLPVDNDTVMVVSSLAPDPGNLGYQEKIDTMLSTLQIIK